jgi:G6PDH family F420-dependent oxidoreductase
MKIGYFLSSEEARPEDLVTQAKLAEQAGFDALWISDHYHPWNDQQGQSPFVWSVIGAISQVTSLPVTTAVTCPTVRIHPAVIAQAAATAAAMLPRGFQLGVGSGEALNEHITGARWPTAEVRLDMLEEAIEVIRALWTGESVHHHGGHYTVEDARIYTLPASPPPIYVSGFGPRAVDLAARIGDGFVCTIPSADLVTRFRENGGGAKTAQAGLKVCWSPDREVAVDTAFRLWPNAGVPGELSQILPSPRHFEQAAQLVTRQMIAESTAFGDEVDQHAQAFQPYADAGFDEIFVSQMGAHLPDTNAEGFFEFYSEKVLPRLRDSNS